MLRVNQMRWFQDRRLGGPVKKLTAFAPNQTLPLESATMPALIPRDSGSRENSGDCPIPLSALFSLR
jgi:hypothetical protein